MIRMLFRLLTFAIIALVALFFLAPRFISSAGNSLVNALDSSSASGIAQMVPDASGKNTVLQAKLDGLLPKTHYDITINEDQCNGTVLIDAGLITADSSGNALLQSTVAKLDQAVRQHTLWLNVHLGGDAYGPSIACGQIQVNNQVLSDISSNQTDTSLQAPAAQNQPNQSAVQSTGSSPNSDTPNEARNHLSGYPQTGVAPEGKDSYDNYTFPRKF
jgi:hypothetical protein